MSNDPAMARFFVIHALRIIGVLMVLAGLVIVERGFGLPPALGYGLLGGGLVAVLALPTVLARRWRSPRP